MVLAHGCCESVLASRCLCSCPGDAVVLVGLVVARVDSKEVRRGAEWPFAELARWLGSRAGRMLRGTKQRELDREKMRVKPFEVYAGAADCLGCC